MADATSFIVCAGVLFAPLRALPQDAEVQETKSEMEREDLDRMNT
jgi:hypothetical protein